VRQVFQLLKELRPAQELRNHHIMLGSQVDLGCGDGNRPGEQSRYVRTALIFLTGGGEFADQPGSQLAAGPPGDAAWPHGREQGNPSSLSGQLPARRQRYFEQGKPLLSLSAPR
jgi:hypothetical protein